MAGSETPAKVGVVFPQTVHDYLIGPVRWMNRVEPRNFPQAAGDEDNGCPLIDELRQMAQLIGFPDWPDDGADKDCFCCLWVPSPGYELTDDGQEKPIPKRAHRACGMLVEWFSQMLDNLDPEKGEELPRVPDSIACMTLGGAPFPDLERAYEIRKPLSIQDRQRARLELIFGSREHARDWLKTIRTPKGRELIKEDGVVLVEASVSCPFRIQPEV